MGNLFIKKDLPDGRLSLFERISYGSGNFANALVYTVISSYLIFYYTDIVGLNAGIIGSIMLFSRIFDGVTDLVMGTIVDRTKSKKGKGRVWILRICIPYALASVLLFAVPINATIAFQYIFVFLSYNLVNAILYTALAVPYNTMGCLITDNSYERGLLGIFSMGASCLAGVLLNSTILKLVGFFGNTPSAWTKALALYAVVGVATHLLCFGGTKERVTESVDTEEKVKFKDGVKSLVQNKYWVMFLFVNLLLWMMITIGMGSTVYFSKEVLKNTELSGLIFNISSILQIAFLVCSFVLIKKIGKGRTLLVGGILMGFSFGIMLLNTSSTTLALLGAALKGMGSGVAGGCALGVTADTIDYSEWKSGIRATGLGSCVISFSQKVASGFGGAIMGWVLNMGGYNGQAVEQTASAITAIKVCYITIPVVLAIGMCTIMAFYDLDKKNPQIHADLAARRGEQA